MRHTLTLLTTSPRVAAGVLTRDAWTALSAADVVYAGDVEDPQSAAIAQSGMSVVAEDSPTPGQRAQSLVAAAGDGDVVWIGSPDGDPGLTDALAGELTRLEEPPEVEVLVGSWDRPGARLLDAAAVVDALRSPGGCPWDAAQTHESLVKYLLEEAHEAVEAIESGDREHLLEELGDVLFQVLFHARIAAEDMGDPFDIDDVAAGLVAKLLRRHPHVFGDGDASTPEEVEAAWEQIKAREKPDRAKVENPLLAGIPASLSTLLMAEKVLARLERTGAPTPVEPEGGGDLGHRLLCLVAEGRSAGESADTALRRRLRQLSDPTP
ncbi:MazG family protein [Leekyejoonella antrihumi]|uniref:MazG family protein n=1 Tax=Leekyejoonella antrihumi TaxID=1660198 RepID=A0A563DUV4_9MICO|nr:MazG family protein [Leekyejoonella antrihumi]TWP33474.1 MazG family protein [Leekyejoonella antrihumi]